MESAGSGGSGGGGGPAPFLMKTYEMVDDPSTNDIVSWGPGPAYNSFIVWNPPEFEANLLPTYFKHNNFSSFIRQLNTYGFRKIDPERWEFSNEEFIKDRKDLLKNIHRRKPVHSHSQTHPPGAAGGLGHTDSERRIAWEEEIERLTREKAALTADLWRFQQQQSGTKIQLDDLERRLFDMEQRQVKMLGFLDRALRNDKFVHNLVKMAGSGPGDLSVLHKKRRLPAAAADSVLELPDNCFYATATDNGNGTSSSASKPGMGGVLYQDFFDKLRLGLCPAAVSDSSNNNGDDDDDDDDDDNVVIVTARSSSEVDGSPRVEMDSRNVNGRRLECLSFVQENTLEVCDSVTSMCPKRGSLFSGSIDDGDGLILSLASSPMQIDKAGSSSRNQNTITEETVGVEDDDDDDDKGVAKTKSTLQEATGTSSQGSPPAAVGRANDVFWEQFLTERPGSSDTEEASSTLRKDPSGDQQEERRLADDDDDSLMRNRKDMEKLSL